jgi:hypothetical protein
MNAGGRAINDRTHVPARRGANAASPPARRTEGAPDGVGRLRCHAGRAADPARARPAGAQAVVAPLARVLPAGVGEADILPALAPRPRDAVVVKPRHSGYVNPYGVLRLDLRQRLPIDDAVVA